MARFFCIFIFINCSSEYSLYFCEIIDMINPKGWLKKNIIHSKYKDQLKIINYTPNSLEFDSIKIINISDKSLEKANNKLIEEAYNLKADAIINTLTKLVPLQMLEHLVGQITNQ